MTAGVLPRPDPSGRAFAFAIALHALLVGSIFLGNWLQSRGPSFGDPNAGGASVGVEAVDKIPLPQSGPKNPVAHDSDSEAPEAKPEKIERVKDDSDAIKLNLHKEKDKKKSAKEAVHKRLKSFDQLEANQITSSRPQQMSDPMFSERAGSGRIGTGMNTTLGSQFGAYAAQVRDQIARNWNTGDVTVRTGPIVIARFDLMRDGSVRNLVLFQTSGIYSLDTSVRRAIETAHLPPLPVQFDKSSARCEFSFELKK
jgi:outer membrane biosynthesis protein TonB